MNPAVSYPPLSWDLACLIAVKLVVNGLSRYGIGVLLAFDCLLRVGELTALYREDVADSSDIRVGHEYKGMTLRLRSTKTGPNQWVEVHDPTVITYVRQLVAQTRPGDLLFPFSSDVFRRVFKRTCADLDLSSRYVPHSLRHGGATRLCLMGWRMEDILRRGRW